MTTWFVSRHPGAVQWAAQQGLQVDKQVAHLDLADVSEGDVVIGSLPIQMVAELCKKNALYYHLTLNLTYAMRGKELTASDLHHIGAALKQYKVVEG